MRILFINSIRDWGGGEVWLFDIVAGLQAKGHQVTIGCHKSSQIHSRAKQQGLPVHAFTLRGGMHPAALVQVAWFVQKARIDIICTNMDHDLRAAALAKWVPQGPVLIPSREVDMALDNRTDVWFFSHLADGVLANSKATARSFLSSVPRFPREKVRVVYKGIEIDSFRLGSEKGALLRKNWDIDDDEPVVGYVGKFSERKGVPILLHAAERVLTENPKAKFLFAGEGPLEKQIRQWVSNHSLADRCILPGFVEDKQALMNAVDILVLPSLFEGFGYVLVEAMSAGKAVISTKVSSAPEIVENGKTGLLVKPNDVPSLFDAIMTLLKNPNLRNTMGLAGLERARRLFDRRRMIDETERFFSDLCPQR